MSNRTNAPRPNAGSAARVQAQRETAGNLEITARRLDLLLKGKAAIESDEARNTRYEEAIYEEAIENLLLNAQPETGGTDE